MSELTYKTEYAAVGNLRAKLTVENDLDTKVEIEGGCLIWVSGPERKQFLEELNAVIDKYRI